MEHLFDLARAFGHLPPLKGTRVAIVTNAGGPGILATDAIERAGLELARFQPEVIHLLETNLPDAASAANPVDVLGDAHSDRYKFALEQVTASPDVDAVLVILTPQAMTEIAATAQVVVDVSQTASIPILTCFMGEARIEEGIRVLALGNLPNFPFPERAAAVLSAMHEYTELRTRPTPQYETFDVDQAAAGEVIRQVRADGRVTIGDAEARQILIAYGLQVPDSRLAHSADEAVDMAGQMGYPVVLKIASPDILHKTDAGGVKVGLESAADVRDAFDLIMYRAQRYFPEAQLWGCQVQKMVPEGLEILIGMNRDPQFGPLVTFGLGGIYVEMLQDVAFRVAPFSRDEAFDMVGEIRAHALLDGVRGQPPADKDAIVEALLRVAQLVDDFPEITELDINPFMAYEQGQGGVAIDMRVVLRSDQNSGIGWVFLCRRRMMKALYVTSVESYSGKTAFCLALGKHLQAKGLKLGYLKPLSTQPWRLPDGTLADEDATFVRATLGLEAEPSTLSPVVVTDDALRRYLKEGKPGDLIASVDAAAKRQMENADVLLIEGGASLREGYALGLSNPSVAEHFASPALVLVKYRGEMQVVDDALTAQFRLGDLLMGVILNHVPESAKTFVDDYAMPFIRDKGISVLGSLPAMPRLAALSLQELVDLLDANVLNQTIGPGSAGGHLHRRRHERRGGLGPLPTPTAQGRHHRR